VRAGFSPLDRKLKLEAYRQTSLGLEQIVCELGIRLPYRQVSRVMTETLKLSISDRQVEHILDRHGQRAIAQRDEEIEAAWAEPEPVGRQPAGPEVLYIEADGAWINSREGLKMEGKVGLVHQGPVKIGQNRQQLQEAVYICSFQGSDRLGQELYREAERQGLERAAQVVFLSDGDRSLQDIYQTHFYDALYVLDWFHLRRNLYRALKPARTDLDMDYLAACYMTLKDLLWFGEVDLALQRLDRLRGQLRTGQARDAITDFKRYLITNRNGIGYADLYEQGIHVGSGPIEKAADLIINRRCELRGMAWYRATADGICNLRSLYLNGSQHWLDFWPA
jgi:hypothetical protein